jgi:hypothetical protein
MGSGVGVCRPLVLLTLHPDPLAALTVGSPYDGGVFGDCSARWLWIASRSLAMTVGVTVMVLRGKGGLRFQCPDQESSREGRGVSEASPKIVARRS